MQAGAAARWHVQHTACPCSPSCPRPPSPLPSPLRPPAPAPLNLIYFNSSSPAGPPRAAGCRRPPGPAAQPAPGAWQSPRQTCCCPPARAGQREGCHGRRRGPEAHPLQGDHVCAWAHLRAAGPWHPVRPPRARARLVPPPCRAAPRTTVTSVSRCTRSSSGCPSASASANLSRMLAGSATPLFSSTILGGRAAGRQGGRQDRWAGGWAGRGAAAAVWRQSGASTSLWRMARAAWRARPACRVRGVPPPTASSPRVRLPAPVSHGNDLLKGREELILEAAACRREEGRGRVCGMVRGRTRRGVCAPLCPTPRPLLHGLAYTPAPAGPGCGGPQAPRVPHAHLHAHPFCSSMVSARSCAGRTRARAWAEGLPRGHMRVLARVRVRRAWLCVVAPWGAQNPPRHPPRVPLPQPPPPPACCLCACSCPSRGRSGPAWRRY